MFHEGRTLNILDQVFISEITARAYIIADSNKRRTLSRADISKALSKSDQFDFLIDIVPRDELAFPSSGTGNNPVIGASPSPVKKDSSTRVGAPSPSCSFCYPLK